MIYNKEYDELTLNEIIKLYENCKDRVVLHNGHVIKFEKDGESKEIQEHIVSVDCAWSQRAYSASISGFYCGYRAAVAILDRIEPYSGCSVKMTARILSMEHRLGYIESFEEIERRSACDIFC